MRVLICPDKFKGSLTASQVCQHVEKGIQRIDKSIEAISLPLADGGEGTLDVLTDYLSLERVALQVHDPLDRLVDAYYYRNQDTAFVEMAVASGLPLLATHERNCRITSTYGTGELIKHAIESGASIVYLFVGGSATNDAGIGMAAALGYEFLDKEGRLLKPVGENLLNIQTIRLAHTRLINRNVDFRVITDVKNVFYGTGGAARNYAAQKGATEDDIELLDEGLRNIAELIKDQHAIDLQTIPGSGAAGGLGGGAVAFLGAKLSGGIETVLQLTEFEKKLSGVDMVITGEGKLDHQTLQGKVVDGVYRACKARNIPVAVICGISELSKHEIAQQGYHQVISLVNDSTPTKEAMERAGELLEMRISAELHL